MLIKITCHSFYSTSSSPLLLRGAPNTRRILYRSFTPKRHRKLRVKDLPKVPSWRLERNSNPWPFGRKATNLSMNHSACHALLVKHTFLLQWFTALFILDIYLYSACSSPLLLTGTLDTAQILCRSFTPKRHRQLRVKNLPKVPTWWLERVRTHDAPVDRYQLYHEPPRPTCCECCLIL